MKCPAGTSRRYTIARLRVIVLRQPTDLLIIESMSGAFYILHCLSKPTVSQIASPLSVLTFVKTVPFPDAFFHSFSVVATNAGPLMTRMGA